MESRALRWLGVVSAWMLFSGATELPASGLVRRPPVRFTNSIGMEFVLVERTRNSEGKALNSFWIGRYEVTVLEFERFESETGYRLEGGSRNKFSPTDRHPVVGISYPAAVAFARWLSAKEGLIYRLPKVSEWEIAAGGEDGRRFPWGNFPGRPGVHGNWNLLWKAPFLGLLPTLTPVGRFPAGRSPFGAYDMIGNASEWCDWDENKQPKRGREIPRYPMKGGSWKLPEPPSIQETLVSDFNEIYEVNGFRLLLESRDAEKRNELSSFR